MERRKTVFDILYDVYPDRRPKIIENFQAFNVKELHKKIEAQYTEYKLDANVNFKTIQKNIREGKMSYKVEQLIKSLVPYENNFKVEDINLSKNCQNFLITFVCKFHGKITLDISEHAIYYMNCPNCDKINNLNNIILRNKNMGCSYDYSKVEYINDETPVIVICNKISHGEFEVLYNKLDTFCPVCESEIKLYEQTKKFIEKSKELYPNMADYSEVIYFSDDILVEINCLKHGIFSQKPKNHLNHFGCLKCYPKLNGYSKAALEWLNYVEKFGNIKIQHAQNGGEYKIPGTAYSADGYWLQNNTIFEFHGCVWHGCNVCYSENNSDHPRDNRPNKYFLDKTNKRKNELQQLGYNVFEIWEHDWNRMKKLLN
jgi:hypothetical protein